jgi:hypothetical protein
LNAHFRRAESSAPIGTRILATLFPFKKRHCAGSFRHINSMILKTYSRTITGAVRGWAKLDSSPVCPRSQTWTCSLAIKPWCLASWPMAKLRFSIQSCWRV